MKLEAIHLGFVGAAALSVAAFFAGCTAFVWPEPQLRCETSESCPFGFQCNGIDPERFCARCDLTQEACDAADNDCDGLFDEPNDDGTPLCPREQMCVGGRCRAGCVDVDGDNVSVCDPPEANPDCNDDDPLIFPGANELCNAQDDDCDMRVDEGLDIDSDNDGNSSCQPNDRAAEDCDDHDSMVSPYLAGGVTVRPEVCNGQDDDCNPGVGDSCPGGDQCTLTVGNFIPQCVALTDCRANPTTCGAGTVCDSDGRCRSDDPSFCPVNFPCAQPDGAVGVCRTDASDSTVRCRDLRDVGEVCTNGAECGTGLCLPAGAVDSVYQNGQSVCGLPCCSDSDCAGVVGANGNQTICGDGGHGIRSCIAGTVPGPSTCVADNDCPSGQSCQVFLVDGVNVNVRRCATAGNTCVSGSTEFGLGVASYCSAFGPCTRIGSACERFCTTDADCPEGACSIRTITDTNTGRSSDYSVCVLANEVDGRRAAGAACGSDRECRSNVCFSGRCSQPCCGANDCEAGFCAPVPTSADRYSMICTPRPPVGTFRRGPSDAGVPPVDAAMEVPDAFVEADANGGEPGPDTGVN